MANVFQDVPDKTLRRGSSSTMRITLGMAPDEAAPLDAVPS
jgi:hypothetical protein